MPSGLIIFLSIIYRMVLLVNTVQQMEIKKEKHVMESIQQMENNCKSSSKGLDQITEDFLCELESFE